MQPQFRTVTQSESSAASALVHTSFTNLAAADWTSKAQQVLLSETSPEQLSTQIATAAYAAGAFVDDQMVGFLLMPTPTILGMLFVHPERLRRGIGKSLWEAARAHIESSFPSARTVELNATPYAVLFYRSIGFVPISAEFTIEGCRATRMACWLPARALGADT
jgi:GNAT superfamily N-acetyltransferase